MLILLSMTAEPAEMRMAHLGLIVLSDVFWSVFPSSLQSSAKQGYLSFRVHKEVSRNPRQELK